MHDHGGIVCPHRVLFQSKQTNGILLLNILSLFSLQYASRSQHQKTYWLSIKRAGRLLWSQKDKVSEDYLSIQEGCSFRDGVRKFLQHIVYPHFKYCLNTNVYVCESESQVAPRQSWATYQSAEMEVRDDGSFPMLRLRGTWLKTVADQPVWFVNSVVPYAVS